MLSAIRSQPAVVHRRRRWRRDAHRTIRLVTVRPIRIAALTIVIIAAVLQLSFGSQAPAFRVANAAILIVAASVLTVLIVGSRRARH